MKTLTTVKQLERLKEKGINVSRSNKDVLSKYSYFQLINAYKSLFVDDVKTIIDIKEDIRNGRLHEYYCKAFGIHKKFINDNQGIYTRILKILKKKYMLNCLDTELEVAIQDIDYVHHVYKNNVDIEDFVRILKFEHRMRAILMKYVLIIEENLKNTLCTYLNDINAENDFLLNISNYDLSNPEFSIKSLGQSMNIIRDNKSLPLNRKIEQQLLPSYWITIHASTLNSVIRTIQNLKKDHFEKIKKEIFKKFCDTTCFSAMNDNEIVMNSGYFFYQLLSVGDFRNQLAHNNPMYQYNLKNSSMKLFPNIQYNYPFPSSKWKRPNETEEVFKRRQTSEKTSKVVSNLRLMQSTFGVDAFNSRTTNVNIDLSYVIYLVNKMISVLDENNTLAEELRDLYYDFGITSFDYDNPYSSLRTTDYYNLLSELEETTNSIRLLDVRDINDAINNGTAHTRLLQSANVKYATHIKDLDKILQKLKSVEEKRTRTYELFEFNDEYKKYTGIDSVFIRNL